MSNGFSVKVPATVKIIASAPALARGEEHPALMEVQLLLKQFGYLDAAAIVSGILDAPTAEALAAYQRLRRLPESGEFDFRTRDLMSIPHCGNIEQESSFRFSRKCCDPESQRLKYTFAFAQGTPDVAGNAEFDAVRRAFATWAGAGQFQFQEVPSSEDPFITVRWGSDPALFDANVLAVASSRCSKKPRSIRFVEEWNWGLGFSFFGRYDIETVALHEIGHILGFAHSEVPESIMFESYPIFDGTRRSLHPDDIAALDFCYGRTLQGALSSSIIIQSSKHFGNQPDILGGEFVGRAEDFTFACPLLDRDLPAFLLFQARAVSHGRNRLFVNGAPIVGRIPATAADRNAWAAQVLLVDAGVLMLSKNTLRVESLDEDGTTAGNVDDFVIDNVVVLYHTITPGVR